MYLWTPHQPFIEMFAPWRDIFDIDAGRVRRYGPDASSRPCLCVRTALVALIGLALTGLVAPQTAGASTPSSTSMVRPKGWRRLRPQRTPQPHQEVPCPARSSCK